MPGSFQAPCVELSEGEIGLAVALWRVCGLTRPWNDPEADAKRALRGGDEGGASTILAVWGAGGGPAQAPAHDSRSLVGTAMVGHDGHRGWVYYVAVHPQAQRRGIGRHLMRACEEWVAARGIPKLQLMVRTDNQQAHEFYRRLGYDVQECAVWGRRLSDGLQLHEEGPQSHE